MKEKNNSGESGSSKKTKQRIRKVDRSWINIGHTETSEEDENVDRVIEFITDAARASARRSSRTNRSSDKIDYVILNSLTYDKLNQAENEHEAEKKFAHGHSIAGVQLAKDNPGGTLPIEWYTFRIHSPAVGFDLEMWWRRSNMQVRINAIFVALLLGISIAYFLAAFVYITLHFTQTTKSPYICETPGCEKASTWMTEAMNLSVDPCDNFYDFMCGNYKREYTEGHYFEKVFSHPGFKMELGGDSLLSKILKDYRGDPTYDQSIQYYQSCLDERGKEEEDLETFLDKIEFVFGTRDFSTFDSMAESNATAVIHQIAIRLFKVVGHAYFLNMAFFTYPYIQLLMPQPFLFHIADPSSIETNREFVEKALNYLMPNLGLQENSVEITAMVEGVMIWSEMLNVSFHSFVNIPAIQDFNVINKFNETFATTLGSRGKNLCPPMGISMSYDKILDIYRQFLQDDLWNKNYRDNYDYTTFKYLLAQQFCFESDSTPDLAKFNNKPRLAFVSLWIFGMFYEMIPVMHNGFVYNFVNETLLKEMAKNSPEFIGRGIYDRINSNLEYKCMEEMWRALGYLPALRYLAANYENPVELIEKTVLEIEKMYYETRQLFWKLPKREMHRFMERQGQLLFRRDIHVDIPMPLVGETLDTFREHLGFTGNHLNNHFIALNLTIESGRLFWLGSTDPVAEPKWWGSGERNNIRDQLLELRFPFISSAKFIERPGAFTLGEWTYFLGERDTNYLLFSLALITEPHIRDTLAMNIAGKGLKIIRSMLSLVGSVFDRNTYPYFYYGSRESEMLGPDDHYDPSYPVSNQTCQMLSLQEDDYFLYKMKTQGVQNLTLNTNADSNNRFLNIMAVKFAYKIFKEKRRALMSRPYTELTKLEQQYLIQRILPGDIMEKYSEDKLFFMVAVRHLCRTGWKASSDRTTSGIRYHLEASILNALMQSEEFSDVWNCKGKSFMNNMGEPKCYSRIQ